MAEVANTHKAFRLGEGAVGRTSIHCDVLLVVSWLLRDVLEVAGCSVL
jgi:hypothetical protein